MKFILAFLSLHFIISSTFAQVKRPKANYTFIDIDFGVGADMPNDNDGDASGFPISSF